MREPELDAATLADRDRSSLTATRVGVQRGQLTFISRPSVEHPRSVLRLRENPPHRPDELAACTWRGHGRPAPR